MLFKTFCSKCVQSDPPGQPRRRQLPGVVHHAAHLVGLQVLREVLNNVLELLDGGWLDPLHMGQRLAPEGEVEMNVDCCAVKVESRRNLFRGLRTAAILVTR